MKSDGTMHGIINHTGRQISQMNCSISKIRFRLPKKLSSNVDNVIDNMLCICTLGDQNVVFGNQKNFVKNLIHDCRLPIVYISV